MAETLTEQTAILAEAIEDEDLLWLVHMSAAANTRDRKVSIENLREAFSISQGSIPAIQTAHGLSVGDVITINLSGAYVEATADLESNAGVVGVVVKVIDANAFRFKTSGYVSGLSGLTVGEIYYLQDAGGLGTTEGTIVRPVLVAVTTTEGIILTVSSGNAVDSSGNAVDSVFSRTGIVTAQASDYDASQVDNDSGVAGAFVSDALDTLAAGAGATTISTLLAITGTQVKLVYISANTRWEYPDGTVPSLTGRAASITWEGTSAQIPAQGTADAEFQVGDTAFVRDVSL